jgi:hypothetical protein
MNEIQLRDSLFELFPPDDRADWDGVLRRAHRSRAHVRRLMLVFALALLATLAVGSALALSGRLGNLFHGTPVNDLTPRERFLMTEFDLNGKAELIAQRAGTAFYVIRRPDGRRCYFVGRVRHKLTPAQKQGQFRFGSGGCIDPRIFPSRALPVLDYSFYSYRRGDATSRLAGLQGFAADPVERIGVIGPGNRIVFSVPVVNNVYTAGRRGFPGGRGVVALDGDGKVLWAQCTAAGRSVAPQFPSGGCGKYKSSPGPPIPPSARPKRPPEPRNPVRQQGSSQGVTFTIRGSHIRVDFTRISAALRRILVYKDGRVTLGCFKLVTVAGQVNASGTGVSRPFASVIEISPWNPYARTPVQYAPFDGCTMSGNYGHSWGDAHGTHDAIEIPLTRRGRIYLAERAVARDLGWLTHARVFRPIRYAQRPFASAAAARWLGDHAVPLRTASSTPPLGKLGIWLGPARRIMLVERAPTGRRLFVELRRGITYRTNLLGLAKAF